MRQSLLILLLGAGLAGCAAAPGTVQYAFRPDTTVAQKDMDSFECEVAATRAVPVSPRIAETPGIVTPPRVYCRAGTCTGVGGREIGGRLYSYDTNAGLRAEYFDRCLAERGYAITRLPRCARDVVPDDAAERLDGALLPPRETACAVNVTERASNLLYAPPPP